MSYKINRESTNLFIKMALPNFLNADFKASGKDFYTYVLDTARELEASRQTVLNWLGGETMPNAADFTFLCWKKNVRVQVNSNGYLELVPADSIEGSKNICPDVNP